MEILSPAGSLQAAVSAVLSGADAVYLGASAFNARINAKNFSDDDLISAVVYCHKRNVRVYAAINTLISDREITEALKLSEKLANIGVDAFIVQDIGFAGLLKKATQIPLHASTQMAVHNLDGVSALASLGFSRVVLARELSFDDIRYISQKSSIETEVFVHGAFCMAYSGQCYMSSIIGGRSGNRGLCAQPCRLPYQNGYELSLKDNCLLEHLEKLREIGVASLKIEGRMKSAEYVAAVTDAYVRRKNGEKYSDETKRHLAGVFSRQGFTDGYFTGNTGKNMFGFRKEDEKSIKITLPTPTEEYKRFPLDFKVKIDKNILIISAETSDGFYSETPLPLEFAEKRATSPAEIEKSLSKLGGTPYYMNSFSCKCENLFIPISKLNETRRKLVDNLTNMRLIKNNSFNMPSFCQKKFKETRGETAVEAFFLNPLQIPQNADNLTKIWLPSEFFMNKEAEKVISRFDKKVGAVLPPFYHDSENNLITKAISAVKSFGITDVLCNNLGHITKAFDEDLTPHGNYALNAFNAESVKKYLEMGLKTATLSFELNMRQCEDLCGEKIGIIAYGRLPFMVTKNCIKGGNGKGCSQKNKNSFLVDRIKKQFLLTCGFGCRNYLWNSDLLWIADKSLPNFGFIRLLFTDESKTEAENVINAYTKISGTGTGTEPEPEPPKNFTRGNYY